METNEKFIDSLGLTRLKHLQNADGSFVAGDVIDSEKSINEFIAKIDGGKPEGDYITQEFDKIEVRKQSQIRALNEQLKEIGNTLERTDIKRKGEDIIFSNEIFDKKAVCWTALRMFKLDQDATDVEYEL